MIGRYKIDGIEINSLDLKALVISRGVKVSDRVYREFGKQSRLYSDPLKCNSVILPDGTIMQLTDLSFHMSYIKSAISWDIFKQLKYLPQMKTPFILNIDKSKKAILSHNGEIITEVSFPKSSSFYEQKTSSGLPFLNNAVLQGTEWLSFQCLWSCEYACAGEPCQYCYSGGVFESRTKKKKPLQKFPTPQDAAEIVEYAIVKEQCAKSIQITGGSTFNTEAECNTIRQYLDAIKNRVSREAITGEVLIYMTPPTDPRMVDQLFEAGADRISCSLEIWDEELAKIIMPGKTKFTGRKRHLDTLEYIAKEYGPNKACSNFLIGVEPAESCLEGAEFLASKGVVPIASVWIPFGRPVRGSMQAPDLNYYRKVIDGLANIYTKYNIVPPGGCGLNVCMCRDVYLHRDAVLAKQYL